MILSFNYKALKYLRNYFAPELLMFLVSGIYTNNIINYLLQDNIFNNIGLNHGNICIENLELYNNKNINVYLYTVNYINTYINLKEKLKETQKEKQKYINNVIKGIITDRPYYFTRNKKIIYQK